MNNRFLLGLCLCMLFLSSLEGSAQTDPQLVYDIESTGFVHKPLPLDYSKSFELFGLLKKVTDRQMLCDMEDLSQWSHTGVGSMALSREMKKSGDFSMRLDAPVAPGQFLGWGLGFGTSKADMSIPNADWSSWNRLHFYIYPKCEGARSIYLNLYIENDGKIKVPDVYGREGYHEINLINNQWNECFVEMTELSRDRVTKLSFAIEVFGKEQTMKDSLVYYIDDVELQTIPNPEVVSGWQPADNRIIFSTSGYRPESQKIALCKVENHNGHFYIVDKKGKVKYKSDIKHEIEGVGEFDVMDFSDFSAEGEYALRVGGVTTEHFFISSRIWENSAWRVLNFMFCERCGYPVPGKHGACHNDLNGEYNGHLFAINGGWHDAGDMSQQTLQTAEIASSFFEMAANAKKNGNLQLYLRLMEEGRWGLDYVLNTRFADGYRADGWGTNLWTDGFIGTIDDSDRRQINVHNGAFQNYLYAAIEASAAMIIDDDPMMVEYLKRIAEEDFGFAEKRFNELGFDELQRYGHAGMTSNSQYMATISWSASILYRLTGKEEYAKKAAEAINYTIECQRIEPIGKDGLNGFFYKDLNKISTVHFNHQSRDYVFMQALVELCYTQKNHPNYNKWLNSISLYADYLKKIMKYVSPYGMVPSGVYNINENKDTRNFIAGQVWIDGDMNDDYQKQLRNGVKLDEEHYLRIFPVWFSFKGNTACNLSTGKAAAIIGKFLNDKELMNIAEEQLFWVVGKNPFGQSLIYGEGSNYAQLYCALPGEMVGEIPVGMQSRFNEDTPYWPQFNTATYKEVWGSSAAKWISLIAEF